MTGWREKLRQVVADLERERDELKLKLHLAKADGRDEWARLDGKLAASDEPNDARTRTHGFGMDVVRRVAALHDLQLRIARGREGGLEVTLSTAAREPV